MRSRIKHIQLNSRMAAKIRWNDLMKTFLCVLVRCYTTDWEKFTATFNLAFAENLRASGFTDGTRTQPLRSQWQHLKHWKDDIWICVNNTPPAQWAGLCIFVDMIERVTQGKFRLFAQHGVDIQHLAEMGKEARLAYLAPSNPSGQQTPPKTPSQSVPVPVVFQLPSTPTRDPLSIQPPTPLSPCQPVRLNITPTSSLSPGQSARPDATPPPLLFRFWDIKSGGVNSANRFLAGMWDENSGVPIPDSSTIDQRIVSSLLRMHLTRTNVASAFISMSTSPLGVFHRALRAGKAHISILDTSKMDHSQLYSVFPILRQEPIQYGKQGNSRYFGQGEWLIWGAIPSEAIVTTFSTSTLFSISTEYPSIGKLLQLHIIKGAKFNRAPLVRKLSSKNVLADMQSGRSMGQFLKLLNVPQSYISAVAILFALKWGLRSPGDRRASYLQGVQRGYISAFSLELPPTDTMDTDDENEEDPTGEYYEDDDDDDDDDDGDEAEENLGDSDDRWSHVEVDSFATRRASITSLLKGRGSF